MRRAVMSLVILPALLSPAMTDPLRLRGLVEQTRNSTAETRREAAATLATFVKGAEPDPDREGPIELAMIAVLSDDSAVRTQMIDALVDKRLFRRADAARIPTLAVLGEQLQRVLRVKRDASPAPAVPRATSCRVLSVSARDVTLECHGSQCRAPCRHVRTAVTLRAGVRWTLVDQKTIDNEDGACGHCE